jgi:hypothetical protein
MDATESRVIRRLADEIADRQMARRELRTEVLHVLIAKYVAMAERESDWPRKKIIWQAAKHYRVSERTVETALAWFKATTATK